jgi:hypothetical protein
MERSDLELVAIDAVLLVVALLIFQNLEWKVSFAATSRPGISGYAAYYSYSLFTQTFGMSGGQLTLTSPPTLDWLQVIGAVLAVLNGLYLYSRLRTRRAGPFGTGHR